MSIAGKSQLVTPDLISVVIPIYNEELSIPTLIKVVTRVLYSLPYSYELILVNDGSKDSSQTVIDSFADTNKHIVPIDLSRNFGKEIALTAGIHAAKGKAIILMDADLQHPPKLIPEFIKKWENGADVVVGVRKEHAKDSIIKKIGSDVFYKILSKISKVPITPHATDFRLLDRTVADEFNKFTERSRIVRGLIDWLGYTRDYVYFDAAERQHGVATYSTTKLVKLAADTFVSMSFVPLRLAGYLGIIIVLFSAPLGLFMFLDNYFLGNNFRFSGPASLGVLTLFLIGITLSNLGLLSLYISHVHTEAMNRPLYGVRKKRSKK